MAYFLDTDEGDTSYAKLLLASPDEVLKQVIIAVRCKIINLGDCTFVSKMFHSSITAIFLDFYSLDC